MDDWKTTLLCPNPKCQQNGQPIWLQWSQAPQVYHDQSGKVSGVTLYAYCISCGQQFTGYVPISGSTNWTKEGEHEQIQLATKPRPTLV